MASGFVIRKNQYYDSVFLMGVNKRLSEVKGVRQTAVLMGTEKNKRLLFDIGIQDAQIDAAQPDDLIVAVMADDSVVVDAVLNQLDKWLLASLESAPVSNLRTLSDGLTQKPGANLAVISVPGEYAGREARQALEAGLHVFIFSSNVPIEEELELKQFAAQKGLLVLGPDCGTSLIGGVGIGFANSIRKGSIAAIGAAGTGLQEFTCQVHNAGYGISHAIGTGSNDLSDKIGGKTAFAALEALEVDPQTEVIALISKPPGAKTLERLIERFENVRKPVIGCFLGARLESKNASGIFQSARTIDEAVQLAIEGIGGKSILTLEISSQELAWIARERAAWLPEQKYLSGLFAGGTFCYQSQQLFRDAGITVFSNAPLDQKYKLVHPDRSFEHTMVDMGDEYYTQGRPHPMIDGTLRMQRILVESRNPELAILLLDFILGYNASTDPVGELLDAILQAKRVAQQRRGHLTVVASICGTEEDSQDLNLQIKMLQKAGVIVFRSNARAATFCCELLKRG